MKYIRTKNGELYLNLGETQNGIIVEYNYLGDGLDLAVNYEAIKKQADTIEELCDEFVYCHDIITEDYVKEILESKDYICKEIYGAIWTDKGLNYVAKMNGKGELELL